jgi:hypothetical protein
MLAEDAALQGVSLLPRHLTDVQRILDRCLVGWLLQLAAIDELDVGDRRSRRFPRALVLEPSAQRGQHSRKVVIQRGYETAGAGSQMQMPWSLPGCAPATGAKATASAAAAKTKAETLFMSITSLGP